MIIGITVIFGFVRKKSLKTRLRSSFMMLAIFQIVATTFELIATYFVVNPNLIPNVIFYIINFIHYGALFAIIVSFTNCLCFILEEKKREVVKYRRSLYIIYLIQIILVLISPITKWLFYFDENNIYQHGPYLMLISGLSGIYILYIFIFIIINRKYLTRQQIGIVLTITFFMILGALTETICDNLLILNLINSISVLLVYLSWYNPSNYYDKEMEIFNRSAFLIMSNEFFLKSKNFRIIAFKINGLKYLHNIIGSYNKSVLSKQIAEKLTDLCGENLIFRLSTTKLAILIKDNDDKANSILRNLNTYFKEPFFVDEIKISLQIRIASLSCPGQAQTVDDAIDIIESILKRMDETESGTTITADKEELNTAVREHKIQVLLKDALNSDGLYVMYQPIYSVERKKYTTAEALVRLKTNSDEYIGPDDFIPVAEKNGLILQIGEYVFRKVCELIISEKIWERGIEYIHVNLSVVQCMQEKLHEQLFKIMDEYGLEYKYINLEVTETTAVASSDMLKANMERMIDKKINFSLDDFGSGFSNMSTLVEYPFHTIKIDKTIIDSAFKDEKAKTILKNTIKMVKQLQMEIVAEGVESEEQVEELKKMGCNYIQGYYYSKPLIKEEFLGLLK